MCNKCSAGDEAERARIEAELEQAKQESRAAASRIGRASSAATSSATATP